MSWVEMCFFFPTYMQNVEGASGDLKKRSNNYLLRLDEFSSLMEKSKLCVCLFPAFRLFRSNRNTISKYPLIKWKIISSFDEIFGNMVQTRWI